MSHSYFIYCLKNSNILLKCKCQVKMTKNAHLKCTIMSEESGIRIIKDFSAFDAVGIAGNFDNFAVMN